MPKHDEVIKSFYKNEDSKKSFDMSKHMKDKFPYLGIPKPAMALLQKEFLKEEKKKNKIDWNLVFDLKTRWISWALGRGRGIYDSSRFHKLYARQNNFYLFAHVFIFPINYKIHLDFLNFITPAL